MPGFRLTGHSMLLDSNLRVGMGAMEAFHFVKVHRQTSLSKCMEVVLCVYPIFPRVMFLHPETLPETEQPGK